MSCTSSARSSPLIVPASIWTSTVQRRSTSRAGTCWTRFEPAFPQKSLTAPIPATAHAHGVLEGFHHLAFGVKDMDADLAWWAERGYPESMSGAWGEKDKPGSGRFAYVDTQVIGGIDVELLGAQLELLEGEVGV